MKVATYGLEKRFGFGQGIPETQRAALAAVMASGSGDCSPS